MQSLASQDFACEADALADAERLSKKLKWHQLSDIQIVEKRHYSKRGKPKPEAIPVSISYRVNAKVTPLEAEIANLYIGCGRFILATNILNSSEFTADDALRGYKAQQSVVLQSC